MQAACIPGPAFGAGRPGKGFMKTNGTVTVGQEGTVTGNTYDARGNLATSTDALGHTTSYVYDDAGRQKKIVYHDGTYEETGYDIEVGGFITDLSPLSTTGAVFISNAGPKADKNRLFRDMLIWGLSMSVVGAVVSWLAFTVLRGSAFLEVPVTPAGTNPDTFQVENYGKQLTYRLVYRLAFKRPDLTGTWEALIDAHTGEIVRFVERFVALRSDNDREIHTTILAPAVAPMPGVMGLGTWKRMTLQPNAAAW